MVVMKAHNFLIVVPFFASSFLGAYRGFQGPSTGETRPQELAKALGRSNR